MLSSKFSPNYIEIYDLLTLFFYYFHLFIDSFTFYDVIIYKISGLLDIFKVSILCLLGRMG